MSRLVNSVFVPIDLRESLVVRVKSALRARSVHAVHVCPHLRSCILIPAYSYSCSRSVCPSLRQIACRSRHSISGHRERADTLPAVTSCATRRIKKSSLEPAELSAVRLCAPRFPAYPFCQRISTGLRAIFATVRPTAFLTRLPFQGRAIHCAVSAGAGADRVRLRTPYDSEQCQFIVQQHALNTCRSVWQQVCASLIILHPSFLYHASSRNLLYMLSLAVVMNG